MYVHLVPINIHKLPDDPVRRTSSLLLRDVVSQDIRNRGYVHEKGEGNVIVWFEWLQLL